jgi:hypothetical protein|tara:strand:+ start:915 stop:1625 length:711 start_codon:yes stop_codon:yes gene_type:complete
MTEHLDFEDQILIHGDPLWRDNDYMNPAIQVARIRCLLEALPYIRSFFVLGDVPELKNSSTMIPGMDIRAIPFPDLDFVSTENVDSDLLFTGIITEHRREIITLLRSGNISVVSPGRFVSRKRRDTMNRSTKLILNVPQRQDWKWLSLMRTIAGLRAGKATVSIGTRDQSKIAACTYQLDITDSNWQDTLADYVDNWPVLYETAYRNYTAMAQEFKESKPFPNDLFAFWSITDRLS